jgi:hypothetical protein
VYGHPRSNWKPLDIAESFSGYEQSKRPVKGAFSVFTAASFSQPVFQTGPEERPFDAFRALSVDTTVDNILDALEELEE